jgi:SAM-dependent methyltransferase
MKTIVNCPACEATAFKPYITCVDHTVSKKTFNIVECTACGLKFTNPRPEDGEIGNYYKSEEYISHTNTKKGVVAKLYHAVRAYTLKRKLEIVTSVVSRGTILDFGCGTGMFLGEAKAAGWNTVGLEPDAGARKIAEENGIKALTRIEEIRKVAPSSGFDAITLWHVLEHVTDLKGTINELRSLLKDNGAIIVAVPNPSSWDAKHYMEYWAAFDLPRHLYHFDPPTLTRLMELSGFKAVKLLPMKFDSYYVSLLSEKYKTGRQSLIKGFLSGLRSNMAASSAQEYSSVIYVFKKA